MNCQRQDRKKHKTEDASRYDVAHLGRLGWDESSSRIGPTMCTSLHLETRRDDTTVCTAFIQRDFTHSDAGLA
jgi:hypothetical protein